MSHLAVVTGGTRGIGAAISQELKQKGYEVIATYAGNEKVAQKFSNDNGIKAYKSDVSSYEECENFINKISIEFGYPDILVNNAGITRDSMLHKMGIDQWKDVIDTNLNSCFNMCRAVITNMRNNSYGRIINISSINALVGQLGQTNYAATKAGIIGFSKSLARENAVKGITVNVVAPGYIKTEMTETIPEKVMDKIVAQIPIGRLGLPKEIAQVVSFLADEESGFITGETISVNGGHDMH